MKNQVKAVLFGVAIGDALGVPVEFKSRGHLKENPVKGMIGFGSHNQPEGTWSDDSSLTFCLAESLSRSYSLEDLGNRFVNWYEQAYWTAHNEVFDVGIATSKAIQNLKKGINPTMAGGKSEESNGNGSLMRILPLVFYIKEMPIEKRFQIVKEVSSLTHAHTRSVLACFIYLEVALQILLEYDLKDSLENMKSSVNDFLDNNAICSQSELDRFHRILDRHSNESYEYNTIDKCEESEIYSSGYVLHSLEASLWCLLKTNSYEDAVLKAVNLGSDTDTTGAITGGLAGILYGYEAIPRHWITLLAREDEISDLSERLWLQASLKY